MVAPAGCILHATSCTGTCGRATSAQAQALCRDAPPKLWIVARAHAVLHCSTLLVAHIKSEFAKCTFAEVSQTRPLQAPAASAVAPTDGRAHRLPLRVCGRCIGSFSIHAYARAALLPPYHACSMGLTPNDPLAQVYLMLRGGRRSATPCLRRPSRRRQRRR